MFKEKLIKKLSLALSESGFDLPRDIQSKTISKINGGLDLIVIDPHHTGKSSTIVISSIQKLKEAFEDAPRSLILVSSKDKALEMKEQFALLGRYTDLRVHCAFEEGKIDKQGEDIYMGSDIVIGTPMRVFELYLKQHLNLNKIKLFVIDDAEFIVKDAYQAQIDRLVQSLPKCQHLVFTNENPQKLEKLTNKFMVAPIMLEISE